MSTNVTPLMRKVNNLGAALIICCAAVVAFLAKVFSVMPESIGKSDEIFLGSCGLLVAVLMYAVCHTFRVLLMHADARSSFRRIVFVSKHKDSARRCSIKVGE